MEIENSTVAHPLLVVPVIISGYPELPTVRAALRIQVKKWYQSAIVHRQLIKSIPPFFRPPFCDAKL